MARQEEQQGELQVKLPWIPSLKYPAKDPVVEERDRAFKARQEAEKEGIKMRSKRGKYQPNDVP